MTRHQRDVDVASYLLGRQIKLFLGVQTGDCRRGCEQADEVAFHWSNKNPNSLFLIPYCEGVGGWIASRVEALGARNVDSRF